MTTTTFQIINGQPVPDVASLDAPSALARKRELERLLALTRDDPAKASERDRLRAEDAAVAKHLTDLKERSKQENMRRNFAGIGSPLHEAIVARFDAATVAELEADAMARFAERERRNAERKAQKRNVDTKTSTE
jgi:hypothetical protein